MISTSLYQEHERAAFAEAAGLHFAANPQHWTYSNQDGPTPGEFLALRWGLGNDCVLVISVGWDTPVIYGQAIPHPGERS